MKQGLFEVFGTGKLGLKADDLNQHAKLLTKIGLSIPEGIVIATGIFDQLTEQLNFEEPTEQIEKNNCPDFLLSLNEKILDKLEIGTPYAVRSSALSECGGIGIYKTEFFLPTGNRHQDLQNLWSCELSVYASEFTNDAKLWRVKNNSPIGMAILIQPVIGFNFENHYLPALSGVAYTSYNGLATVRAVIGLGTQAVTGSGIIYNFPTENFQHFQREMWDQEFADAISLEGKIKQIHTQYSEIHVELARGFTAFNSLFDKLAKLQKQGGFYLEWSINGDKIFIVQCADYEDQLPGNVSFDSSGYFLLLKSNDVLHSGQATCKGIVYVHEWSPEISLALGHLNESLKDHLLIVPQDALSQLADINHRGHRLAFRHFSQAAAVIEKQITYTPEQHLMLAQAGMSQADHSIGTGATHFAQLCKRSKILFLGGEFDPTPLFSLPGAMAGYTNNVITIWETAVEVMIDAVKNEGYVYVSKEAKPNDYSLFQIREWSNILRSSALELENFEAEKASHFYNVHYALAPDDNPLGFDPLRLDETIVAECGLTGFITSLKVVIANGDWAIDDNIWNSGLHAYLEKLLLHLSK